MLCAKVQQALFLFVRLRFLRHSQFWHLLEGELKDFTCVEYSDVIL